MTETENEHHEHEMHVDKNNPHWERDLLERLAFASFAETRKARRWSVFFKLFLVLYFGISLLYLVLGDEIRKQPLKGELTAIVDIQGEISEGAPASAKNIIAALKDALERSNTKALILHANSPGGSPVQASYITQEIRRLREKYPDKPIYAVVSDTCASFCYYIAVESDRIYDNT